MEQSSEEERVYLAKMIMALLDDWGVGADDRLKLLGLPPGVRIRHLERYRINAPLPDTDEVSTRVEHLIGIADALRTTYPRNPSMGSVWLRTPHRRFAQREPLSLMIDGGMDGLVSVRSELDCTFAWNRSGSH